MWNPPDACVCLSVGGGLPPNASGLFCSRTSTLFCSFFLSCTPYQPSGSATLNEATSSWCIGTAGSNPAWKARIPICVPKNTPRLSSNATTFKKPCSFLAPKEVCPFSECPPLSGQEEVGVVRRDSGARQLDSQPSSATSCLVWSWTHHLTSAPPTWNRKHHNAISQRYKAYIKHIYSS